MRLETVRHVTDHGASRNDESTNQKACLAVVNINAGHLRSRKSVKAPAANRVRGASDAAGA
jgi:hypothetical protein